MSTGKIELSVGAVKYVDLNEIITEEEFNNINNKIPELDGRVGVIEDEIEEINSSLDNIVSSYNSNGNDDTLEIQKIINKNNKITFPFKRTFYISSTIDIPSHKHIDFNFCTFIPVVGGNFINGFMFKVNSLQCDDWIESFGGYSNSIKNITISNINKLANIKGLFIGSVCDLYNIRTEWLYQTIKIVDRFLDLMRIERILVVHHMDNVLYAISHDNTITQGGNELLNKNANGDGWILRQLQFEGRGTRNAIYLNGNYDTCTIDGVINGKIVVQNGMYNLKNIHLEIGNIKIYNAKCTVEKSVLYFNGSINGTPIQIFSKNGQSKNVTLKDVFFTYNFWEDSPFYSKGDYLYAIDIDNLHTSNVILEDVSQGIINTLMETGVRIRKLDKTSISDWDIVAPLRKCVISPYGLIEPCIIEKQLPNTTKLFNVTYKENLVNYSSSEDKLRGILWKGNSGTYYYKIGLITDIDRLVGIYDTTEYSIIVNNLERKCVNITLEPSIINKIKNAYVVIHRGTTSGNYTDRALIPLNNNGTTLIDDYRSIGLINWTSSSSLFTFSFYDLIEVNMAKNTVVAYGTSRPIGGSWKVGDKIVIDNPQVGETAIYRRVQLPNLTQTFKSESIMQETI